LLIDRFSIIFKVENSWACYDIV